jgi:hypothetical protein
MIKLLIRKIDKHEARKYRLTRSLFGSTKGYKLQENGVAGAASSWAAIGAASIVPSVAAPESSVEMQCLFR